MSSSIKKSEFQQLYYGKHITRFGICTIGILTYHICYLGFGKKSQHSLKAYQSLFPNTRLLHRPNMARTIIPKIFNGTHIPIPLLFNGTPFQIKVWKALLKIPKEKLVSYQNIASMIGQKKAARAVGNAIAANHIAYLIPCHRVIKKSGETGKYRWGSARKSAIIHWERNLHQKFNPNA